MQQIRWTIKDAIHSLGYDLRKKPLGELSELEMFLSHAHLGGATTLIDVGANIGQFARQVLWQDDKLEILSVEPQSEAHRELTQNAADTARWHVAPRCAVGAAPSTSQINLTENSYSSSLLKVADDFKDSFAGSDMPTSESVDVKPLDAVLASVPHINANKFALKIDTQGFEMEVLKGCVHLKDRMSVVLVEMSLAPIYDGTPDFREVFDWFRENNFRCVGLYPEFFHKSRPEMLQVNGIFVPLEPEIAH